MSSLSFSRRTRLAATAAILVGVTVGVDASAQQLRFSKTAAGGIASTGNTLGLSKQQSANGPGDWDSIGTFLSLDPAATDNLPVNTANPWFKGTTWDWTKNGSTASLSLPGSAEVLYAELVWGGSYNYVEDLSAKLDTPVTLSFGGDKLAVMPDAATAETLAGMSTMGFAANYYIRSAPVTAFVQKHLGGSYAVSGVPATQHETINKLNAAGWSLVVAFRDDAQPYLRNLSIFVGGSFVDEQSQQDYKLDGFCAPSSGPVEGNLVVSAMEGDANLTGDQLLIGKSAMGTFVNLSGPNNPVDNFFASQLNDGSGMVDVKGSFGDKNHDAFGGKNILGGRQGWDHTTVLLSDVDGHLSNGQNSAVIRTITTGDSYVPTMVAMEIDVKAPNFTDSSTKASKPSVHIGDQVELTTTLTNTGEAPAENLVFSMPLDAGLELISYQTDGAEGDATGDPVSVDDLKNGVNAGSLKVNGTRTIHMTFDVLSKPAKGDTFVFAPMWDHSFMVCTGDKPISETYTPPQAKVQYVQEMVTGEGGSGGSDPSTGSGTAQPPVNNIEQEGDCGCSVPASSVPNGFGLTALVGLAALALRRRRF